MAEERYSTPQLLALRKTTRAVADLLRGELRDCLAALAPLFRPRAVLGNYVESGMKETFREADAAFKELQSLYHKIAFAKPFNLPQEELHSPVEVLTSVLEITPVEYTHHAKAQRETKTVTVTCPLKWVLNYSGFGLKRLQELLADGNRSQSSVREFILHYLALHLVATRQSGLVKVMGALHFPISTGRLPWCGDLPMTYVSSLATTRPPDDVIIESTELSGMDAFEEVVSVSDIQRMRNPLQDRLLELVKIPPAQSSPASSEQ
jgi:hypothetical protein